MRDKNAFFFLIFLLSLCCYKIYNLSEKFDEIEAICIDQEEVISLQGFAIQSQSLYIQELEAARNRASLYLH